jgi:hypothetical protein
MDIEGTMRDYETTPPSIKMSTGQNNAANPIGTGDVAVLHFLIDTENPELEMNETQFPFTIRLTDYEGIDGYDFTAPPAVSGKLEYPLTWTFIGDPRAPLRAAIAEVEGPDGLLNPVPTPRIHRYVVNHGNEFWTQAQITALQNALAIAKGVYESNTVDPAILTPATTALTNAITTFNEAKGIGVQDAARITITPRATAAGFGRIVDIRIDNESDVAIPVGSALVVFTVFDGDESKFVPAGVIRGIPAIAPGADWTYDGISLRSGTLVAYLLGDDLLEDDFTPLNPPRTAFNAPLRGTLDYSFIYGYAERAVN